VCCRDDESGGERARAQVDGRLELQGRALGSIKALDPVQPSECITFPGQANARTDPLSSRVEATRARRLEVHLGPPHHTRWKGNRPIWAQADHQQSSARRASSQMSSGWSTQRTCACQFSSSRATFPPPSPAPLTPGCTVQESESGEAEGEGRGSKGERGQPSVSVPPRTRVGWRCSRRLCPTVPDTVLMLPVTPCRLRSSSRTIRPSCRRTASSSTPTLSTSRSRTASTWSAP
jgi:hypothetical protein